MTRTWTRTSLSTRERGVGECEGEGDCNISINCEQLKRAYEYIMLPGVIYAPVCVCVLATETWRKFAGQKLRGNGV